MIGWRAARGPAVGLVGSAHLRAGLGGRNAPIGAAGAREPRIVRVERRRPGLVCVSAEEAHGDWATWPCGAHLAG